MPVNPCESASRSLPSTPAARAATPVAGVVGDEDADRGGGDLLREGAGEQVGDHSAASPSLSGS